MMLCPFSTTRIFPFPSGRVTRSILRMRQSNPTELRFVGQDPCPAHVSFVQRKYPGRWRAQFLLPSKSSQAPSKSHPRQDLPLQGLSPQMLID